MNQPESELFAILITKPGDFNTPIRVGGLLKHLADQWAYALEQAMTHTAHPEGTAIKIVPFNPKLPHINPDHFAASEESLPRRIRADKGSNGTGSSFPDTYTRLVVYYGQNRADQMWSAACAEIDRDAEIGEHVAVLCDNVNAALGKVVLAQQAVRELVSSRLYHVDLAEGWTGSDLQRSLDDAAHELRAAARIAGDLEG